MEVRDTSAEVSSALIDVSQVPLERLAELSSPVLTKLLSELAAKAGNPEPPFKFSSAI